MSSSSFAQLMKVAEQNTRSSQMEAMEAAKRREAAQRAARIEQEKKEKAEKEMQRQLLVKKAEEAKREEERKKRKEEELAKRKDELARKKQEEAELAKYSRAGPSKESSSRGKSPNSYIVVSSNALTREEKRMARDPLHAETLRARNKANASKKRKDGRLPGGAMNVTDSASSSASGSRMSPPSGSGMSARARIVNSFTPTLTKLNTEKKDLRSIDEVLRDLKRTKPGGADAPEKEVLTGSKAQAFDFFGKRDGTKSSSTSQPPKKRDSPSLPSGKASTSRATASASSAPSKSSQKLSPAGGAPNRSLANGSASATTSKKRRLERSPSIESFSEDDEDEEDEYRYSKKRPARTDGGLAENQRDMIWQLMGKNRRQYTAIDVDSDDDMEVTRADLEREERISARIAKREDAEAEEEDRRRELEKKRRKMEKEKGLRR